MIYISIPEADVKAANDWIRENIDHGAGDSFIVNQEEQTTGDKYCLISLPDNGSSYTEAMKEHFGYIDNTPRKADRVDISLIDKIIGKIIKPSELKLQDISTKEV